MQRARDVSQADPYRVLMTADGVGGVFSYVASLTRALAERNVRTALAFMGGRLTDAQRRELGGIPGLDWFESSFALEWMDDPWSDVEEAGAWLLELERAFRPHVVHLNGYCHASLPWSAPVLVVAHSCVCSWWEAVLAEPLPARYYEYRTRVTHGLASADCVVAPTSVMLRAIERHYGAPPRARTIHNGAWSQDYHADLKQPFVLAAGRVWDRAKNLSLLAEAASDLPWPTYIAGPFREPLPNVRLLGALPPAELRALMTKASVFVHPARYEPFGLAPLEAALSGCALVLAKIESLVEVWGDSACYFALDDARGLARILARLAAEPALVAELGRRARERALSFDARQMGARYHAIYCELVSRESGRTPARRERSGVRLDAEPSSPGVAT